MIRPRPPVPGLLVPVVLVGLLVAACGTDPGPDRSTPVTASPTVPGCPISAGHRLALARPRVSADDTNTPFTTGVAVSPHDVWWFVDRAAWHWDGHCWHSAGSTGVQTPTAAVAFGPANVWVGDGGITARWDGQGWTTYPMVGVAGSMRLALSGSGSNDVWALAEEPHMPAVDVLMHFDGSAWTTVRDPLLDGLQLYDIAADGPGRLWLAASRQPAGEDLPNKPAVLLRHDGGTWHEVVLPDGGMHFVPTSLAVTGPNLWLAGTAYSSSRGAGAIRHWDGHTWQDLPAPANQAGNPVLEPVIAADGNQTVWTKQPPGCRDFNLTWAKWTGYYRGELQTSSGTWQICAATVHATGGQTKDLVLCSSVLTGTKMKVLHTGQNGVPTSNQGFSVRVNY